MKKIHFSLAWKLILSFLIIAITSVALVIFLIRLTTIDRFNSLIVDQQRNYLQIAAADYYTTNGSWDGINQVWANLIPPIPENNPDPNLSNVQTDIQQPADNNNSLPPDKRDGIDRFRLFGLADANGVVIVSLNPEYPAGKVLSASELKSGEPIEVNGETVGTILTANLQPKLTPAEDRYLSRTNQAILVAGLAALVIALVFGILLARQLTKPIQELTLATSKIAEGELEQEVQVRSDDEVGQLTTSFNRMSKEVARANLLRRQMTADIAHDLRTPLTVISGYIEAMRDQVLEPSEARLTMIYSEIEHLQKLVDDLRVLSQAEAGELRLNRQWIQPEELIERAAALFTNLAESKDIHMLTDIKQPLPEIWIDEARIMQVLENLISNALRYTPGGGSITVSGEASAQEIIMAVQDTGSGIAPEDVPLVFQRLYRADSSRTETEGSTGLGLSIAKAFVESHGGTISVESVLNQGTRMVIHLPVSKP
jgi:signal transduction histidine kinase